MADDSNDNLNGVFAFFSGLGTSAWGFSELVQEPIIASAFPGGDILPVIVPFTVLLFGAASTVAPFGLLGWTKDRACDMAGGDE